MGDSCRILVVEDDPAMARAIARVLEHRGMSVVVARSCKEAEAADGGFDAGVFDIDLPDGNGLDLARLLLATGAVAMATFHSGESSVEIRLEASELGSFCSKSQGIHALCSALIEALSECEHAAQAVGAESVDPSSPRGGRLRTGRRSTLR